MLILDSLAAYFFYSFETGRVKTRLRFNNNIDIDVTRTLGANKSYVAPAAVAGSYLKYVKQRALSVDDMISAANDLGDKSRGEEHGIIDDAYGTFIHEHRVDLPQEDQHKNLIGSSVVIEDVEAVAMSTRAVVEILSQVKKMETPLIPRNDNWKTAMNIDPVIAKDAINNELKQIIVDYLKHK